jgi:WD40 repeat protein
LVDGRRTGDVCYGKSIGGRKIAVLCFAFLLLLIADPAGAKIRLVPQLSLTNLEPIKVAVAPGDATLLLVVNDNGRIDVFDLAILGLPVKIAEIGAAALDASFSPRAVSRAQLRIASAGADGMVRLWTLEGKEAAAPFTGHKGRVLSVAFSPDGRRIASGGDDGTVRLWTLDGKEAAAPFEGHEGRVLSVAFSPDGRRIVSGGGDGTVRLWTLDGKEAAAPFEGGNEVFSVAFSPDGTRIASGCDDGTVRLWTLEGKEAAAPFEGHAGWVSSIAFSPDGARIASGGEDGTVRLWTLEGKEAALPFEGHEGNVRSVAFSPDGRRIASAGDDGTVRLWTLEGKEAHLYFEGHEGSVRSVAFSPDGTRIASGGEDGTVRLWTLDGKEAAVPFKGHKGSVLSVAFSPDGTRIASGGDDGTVRLWTLDGKEVAAPFDGHAGWVSSVTFSPDGRRIASGCGDGTVRLWTLEGEEDPPLKGHKGSVLSVAFSPDGTSIASGGEDGTVRLWLHGEEVAAPFEGHESHVSSVAFSPDGRRIASGGWGGFVWLWTVEGKEAAAPFEGHKGNVSSLAFSPDGRRIASGGDDGMVRLWMLEGKEAAVPFIGHEGRVSSVTFSPDGMHIASGGEDGTVRLWTLDGKEAALPFKGHRGGVTSVTFSPDGTRIASGGDDGTVRLWTLDGKEAAAPFESHEDWVSSVAFSPDGTRIASGGADGTVRLWTLDGKEAAVPFKGHEGGVLSVAFSPDGTRIASGGKDGTVRLWTLDGKEAAAPFEGHEGWVFSVAFSPDGRRIASGGEDGTVRLWSIASHESEIANFCRADHGLGFADNRFVWIGCTDRISILSTSFEPRGEIFLLSEGMFGIVPDEGVLLANTRVGDPFHAVDGGTIDWGPQAVVSVPPKRIRQVLFNEWTLPEQMVEIARKAYRTASEWYGSLSVFVQAPLWAGIAWVMAIVFATGCWVLVPHKLAHWVMPAVGSPKPPTWKWLAGILTLFAFLGTTQRPLKNWLRRHRAKLYAANFGDREPVKERERYCNLGHEGEIAEFEHNLTAGKRALRWIDGTGGSGKSALAFRMLREATSSRTSVLLPILIDEDWEGSLTQHVARLLQVGDRAPTPAMVETLGVAGRLCLLIDSLSERGMADVMQRIEEPIGRSAFPAVIVTSRQKPPAGKTWEAFGTMTARPLTMDQIDTYVATYAPEERRVEVRHRIDHLLRRGRSLSPLFVRFAIEQALKGPLTATSARDLVLRYVEELREGKLDLSPDDMMRAAEIAAGEATREGTTPREIEALYLRGVLVKEADGLPFMNNAGNQKIDPAELIDMLVECGLLNRNPINRRLQFAYDPVAEHLAGRVGVQAIA